MWVLAQAELFQLYFVTEQSWQQSSHSAFAIHSQFNYRFEIYNRVLDLNPQWRTHYSPNIKGLFIKWNIFVLTKNAGVWPHFQFRPSPFTVTQAQLAVVQSAHEFESQSDNGTHALH